MLDEDSAVPPAVAELVRRCIDRLETLHVLFLLQSTAPKRWTVREVSLERRSSTSAAEMSLRRLAHHGLLSMEEDGYRFAARTAELADRTVALADCYRARPTAVVTLIYSRRSDTGPGEAG